ncbi:MAG: hypothetical protein ABIB61_01390 [Candidatus Shapirobacteria bacterium]
MFKKEKIILKSSQNFQKGVIQLPIILGLVVLAVTLPAAVLLTSQVQETRRGAAEGTILATCHDPWVSASEAVSGGEVIYRPSYDGWTSNLRLYYGNTMNRAEMTNNPNNLRCDDPASGCKVNDGRCICTVNGQKGNTLWFFNNISKEINGTQYLCTWDDRWMKYDPEQGWLMDIGPGPSYSCINNCEVSVRVTSSDQDGSTCLAHGGACSAANCSGGMTDIGSLDCPADAPYPVPYTPHCCVPKVQPDGSECAAQGGSCSATACPAGLADLGSLDCSADNYPVPVDPHCCLASVANTPVPIEPTPTSSIGACTQPSAIGTSGPRGCVGPTNTFTITDTGIDCYPHGAQILIYEQEDVGSDGEVIAGAQNYGNDIFAWGAFQKAGDKYSVEKTLAEDLYYWRGWSRLSPDLYPDSGGIRSVKLNWRPFEVDAAGPEAPVIESITCSPDSIRLQWESREVDQGCAGIPEGLNYGAYDYQFSRTPNFTLQDRLESGSHWTDNNSGQITGAFSGTVYARVKVRDKVWNTSSWSRTSCEIAPPEAQECLVSGLTINNSFPNQLVLSWSTVNPEEADQISIERGEQLVASLETAETSWHDTGVICGNTYEYRVSCLKTQAGGENLFYNSSNIVSAQVQPCAPECPIGDLDDDCDVDLADIGKLVLQWSGGSDSSGPVSGKWADLSGDSKVNEIDLAILLRSWTGSRN